MKKTNYFFIFFILILSAYLRFSFQSHPFWVDEFSSAEQAKVLIKHGFKAFSQTETYFETHNFTNHLAVALSFLLWGDSETAARVPSMLFGSLVPILVYCVVKEMSEKEIAISASMLTTFSYFEIAWSRQARGYMIQQCLVLVSLIIYFKFLKTNHKLKYLIMLQVLSVVGIMTHPTFLLVIAALIVDASFRFRKNINRNQVFFMSAVLLLVLLIIEILTRSMSNIIFALTEQLKSGLVNNLWYYHSFLWREQTVVSLLSLLGLIGIAYSYKRNDKFYPLIIVTGFYLLFFSFLFGPYVSRYMLPIFPLLLIFAAGGIYSFSKSVAKKYRVVFVSLLTLFIIANGHTFAYTSKAFFSINHSMREVALIDYDEVYDLIVNKGKLEEGKTAVIETWPDRMKWYLGDNKEYMHVFRWANESGLINGLPKQTPFIVDEVGNKRIPGSGVPKMKLVSSLEDLAKVIEEYEKGFIWIDDASLPNDVIKYVEDNLHQELYVDHYRYDDNPYSIWPATLYSWGFDTN